MGSFPPGIAVVSNFHFVAVKVHIKLHIVDSAEGKLEPSGFAGIWIEPVSVLVAQTRLCARVGLSLHRVSLFAMLRNLSLCSATARAHTTR